MTSRETDAMWKLVPVKPTPRAAYSAVKSALSRGIIVRPKSCQRCGVEPPPASDGRSRIQAHHSDYSKPLDVEWICAKCHRAETPLPAVMGAPVYGDANGMRKHPGLLTGSKNGFAKLNEVSAAEIKASRHLTAMELANKFGVRVGTINDIRRKRTWKHV